MKNADNMNNENKSKRGIRNMSMRTKWLITGGGSADPNGSITVDEWGSVTVSFTPNEGYEIQSVTVDGADKGAVESYTLSYITADHSIMATFVKTPEPTPTVEPTADIPDIDDEN